MNAARPIPILDGAYLRCIDVVSGGISVRDGQIAIVERTMDGGHLRETTVKRVAILPNGRYELRPESTNPAHKPLEWSADKERTGEVRVTAIVTMVMNELDPI
jgi:phage repressor protein C with HTH and peptisase S24 domain